MNRFACALLLGSLVLPGAGASQAVVDGELRRAVAALRDSAHIQIMAPGVLIEDGYLVGLHLDSLRVASADALITVGLDEIEGLSVEGTRWRSGAVQGGLVGLVAGAAAGFFLGYWHCGDQFQGCDEHAWRVSLRWGAIFGTAGSVSGAALGSRFRRWRSVFP